MYVPALYTCVLYYINWCRVCVHLTQVSLTYEVMSLSLHLVEMLNYEKVHMTLGPFTKPEESLCFEITIPDNNNCTNLMNFTMLMSPHDPSDDNVTITHPEATIVVDDSMEPECSK